MIDVKSKKRVEEFHTFVKPTNQKSLHECTVQKTGLQDETIFAKDTPNVYRCLQELHKKLIKSGVLAHEFVFVTDGDFSGVQLDREAQFKKYT